jgi:hypothetical protein
VTDADQTHQGILALLERVLEQPGSKTKPAITRQGAENGEPSKHAVAPGGGPQPAATGNGDAETRLRTANELATVILNTLSTLDGCPKRGFVVTVYGFHPWNAMLTITPEAGTVADPALWHERVRELAQRLRQEYDVSDL